MNGHQFLEAMFKRMHTPREWGAGMLYVSAGGVDENWIEVTTATGEKWVIKAERVK